MTSSGLALIGSYSDDDEDSHESDLLPKNVESERFMCPLKKLRKDEESSANVSPFLMTRLPLPSTIVQLFNKNDSHKPPEDDSNLHDGRIRSFPHKRGNWSTYVYLSYSPEEGFDDLLEQLQGCAAADANLQLKKTTELHISLTRTVVLLHHWIDNFVSSVKAKLSHTPRIAVQLGAPEVYCNEERTRTFLGLKVVYGAAELTAAALALDECLAEFRLPPFYQDPSFHMSVLWMVGDVKETLEAILPQLHEEFHASVAEHNLQLGIDVTQCLCKTGNKLFTFPLIS